MIITDFLRKKSKKKKITIFIENECRFEGTLMHYEERPSKFYNSFTYSQVELRKFWSLFVSKLNNFTCTPVSLIVM